MGPPYAPNIPSIGLAQMCFILHIYRNMWAMKLIKAALDHLYTLLGNLELPLWCSLNTTHLKIQVICTKIPHTGDIESLDGCG